MLWYMLSENYPKKRNTIKFIVPSEWAGFMRHVLALRKNTHTHMGLSHLYRNMPTELKTDINSLKGEVVEIKKCTQSVVKAKEVLSTIFENIIGG